MHIYTHVYITSQQKQKTPSTPKKGGRQVLTDAKAKAQEVARKAELGQGVDQKVERLNGIYCVYIYTTGMYMDILVIYWVELLYFSDIQPECCCFVIPSLLIVSSLLIIPHWNVSDILSGYFSSSSCCRSLSLRRTTLTVLPHWNDGSDPW